MTGFDPSRTYYMNMKYLRRFGGVNVYPNNLYMLCNVSALDQERLIPGRKDGNDLHFTGILDASAVGTPVTFDFTILDQGNKIAYTRSVGPKTVNGNLSVDLGDISDATKWKATPYEDLGINNAYGKRMYWARRNLGATADFGNSLWRLFYAWGQLQGYPVRAPEEITPASTTFYKDPAFELDENNRLKPAYDAAYVNLGGAWRHPRLMNGSGSGITPSTVQQNLPSTMSGYY